MFLLDTNVCVAFLRGRSARLTAKLAATPADLMAVPSMVEAELLTGAWLSDSPDRQSDIVQTFLAAFRIEPFDSAAAAHYARLRAGLQRAGTLTGPNNLVIAATALAVGGTLVTHNTKEFRRVVGLPVEDWL